MSVPLQLHTPSPTDTSCCSPRKTWPGTPQDLSKIVIDHFFNILLLRAACMPSSSQGKLTKQHVAVV
ncbi:hypothetical protein GBAR_LOCUS28775 [Geodia barretti]|uniref:Uncharacterized protein n=1 Tax=Geodia barretti TaxID=519541 RepID=A0AA35TQK1_GEOBA|nr:hypothetical protein GBAR_LOCUS28775 [Geodia barretti]